mmetsp:Transcript_7387/g.6730  ORF Transcript_7387/g.6730 Transcript_7387/m.6730 type:complete len:183 (-) Transcript_7387:1527-2075(-)
MNSIFNDQYSGNTQQQQQFKPIWDQSLSKPTVNQQQNSALTSKPTFNQYLDIEPQDETQNQQQNHQNKDLFGELNLNNFSHNQRQSKYDQDLFNNPHRYLNVKNGNKRDEIIFDPDEMQDSYLQRDPQQTPGWDNGDFNPFKTPEQPNNGGTSHLFGNISRPEEDFLNSHRNEYNMNSMFAQ